MRNRDGNILPSCEMKFMLRRKLEKMEREIAAMYELMAEIKWEQTKDESV